MLLNFHCNQSKSSLCWWDSSSLRCPLIARLLLVYPCNFHKYCSPILLSFVCTNHGKIFYRNSYNRRCTLVSRKKNRVSSASHLFSHHLISTFPNLRPKLLLPHLHQQKYLLLLRYHWWISSSLPSLAESLSGSLDLQLWISWTFLKDGIFPQAKNWQGLYRTYGRLFLS